MTPEARIQREVMLALSQAGCLVWRQNTGQAWQGKQLHKARDQITLGQCRPVHFGLCKGSSDVLGIAPGGAFLAVEVKTKTGRVTQEQQNFIVAVNRAGGIGFVARSADDALTQLGERLHDNQ
ncbi:VRR-NUC domain-containing protein [Herbaspirillum sp.]|jgi:hypothetical protein|uniref:VRR-NUC domain-containing protein n=1 Tax=Herbaspirillum sp. TaxID=1890675 RepID=UPI00257D4072|nr:VRR-NUC domain-containing protein [Herbaspirillum sp.]|tara:strand:+ start:43853 stop:44221 length:369 start_codon:yes stop_codon:yes gene_type:complete